MPIYILYHNVLFKLCKKSIPWAREPAGPAGLMTCLLYVESMYLFSDECVSIPSIPLPVYLFTSDGVDIFGKAIAQTSRYYSGMQGSIQNDPV